MITICSGPFSPLPIFFLLAVRPPRGGMSSPFLVVPRVGRNEPSNHELHAHLECPIFSEFPALLTRRSTSRFPACSADSHLYLVSYRTCTMDGTPQFVGVGHQVLPPGHIDADSVVLHGDGTLPSRPVRVGARASRAERPTRRRASAGDVVLARRPLSWRRQVAHAVHLRIRARCPTLPNCRGNQLVLRVRSTHREQHSHARKHARATRDAPTGPPATRTTPTPCNANSSRGTPPRTNTTDPPSTPSAPPGTPRENDDYMPRNPRGGTSGVSAPPALSRPARPGRRPPRGRRRGEGRMVDERPVRNRRPSTPRTLVRDHPSSATAARRRVRWETRRTARRGWRSRRRRAPSRSGGAGGGFVRTRCGEGGVRAIGRIDFARSPRRR